jgi:ABC-2 type transport system ATP-binding protein
VHVLTDDPDALSALLRAKGATVTAAQPDGLSVSGIECRDVGILAAGAGLTLYELSTQRASLEDAFMELTHEHADFTAPKGADVTAPIGAHVTAPKSADVIAPNHAAA